MTIAVRLCKRPSASKQLDKEHSPDPAISPDTIRRTRQQCGAQCLFSKSTEAFGHDQDPIDGLWRRPEKDSDCTVLMR